MSDRLPTQEEFLKHVAQHELTIELDAGVHRCILLSQRGTSNRQFRLTTWPGYLAYSGDMGDFVFARTSDMFGFFRGDDINLSYWAEKLQAVDRGDGHREFSHEKYLAALKSDFAGWAFDDDETRAKAWERIEWNNLPDRKDSAEAAVNAVMAYTCPISEQSFVDFWDHTFEEYTYRFVWCCRAIIWGIAQYDAAKAKVAA